ncbi:MAG: hypothetical protein QNK37_34765 [Acidobacteriota bacterium]|nr:hypothetical protein [Acidobacteriota bacterium]
MLEESRLMAYLNEAPSDQLLPECKALARYSLASGLKVSPKMLANLSTVDLVMRSLKEGKPLPEQKGLPRDEAECSRHLSRIHTHFCEVIAPAKPRSVLLLEEQRDKSTRLVLGPVPIVRRMMVVAIVCLFSLLGMSLIEGVDGASENISLSNSGWSLFYNYLYLIAASGLGASFAALFQTNQYVKARTFDPKYDQSYWNRFFLGVTAGLIMACFFPTGNGDATDSNLSSLGAPLLAILGGFSSSAVHRILSRIVATMESLFKGDPKAVKKATYERAQAGAARQITRTRMELAAKLTALHGQLGKDGSPEAAAETLDRIQDDLFSDGATSLGSIDDLPDLKEKTEVERGELKLVQSKINSRRLLKQLASQCLAMMDFANDSGKTAPPEATRQLEQLAMLCRQKNDDEDIDFDEPRMIEKLAEIHNLLAALIVPASPRTILILAEHKKPGEINLLRFRGTVPLVRHLRAAVLLSLAGMVLFSLFESVDGRQSSFNITEKFGIDLALNYLFLLSAASMGACFSGLFTANQYIKEGTFDNVFQSTYWSRYVLGLMGGIMIAMLVPLEQFFDLSVSGLGPSLLALLGGFAAGFVYRVLDKLVKVMESLVKADPKTALAAREMQAQSRLAGKASQQRLDQAREINRLQKKIAATGDVASVQEALLEMQQRLLRQETQAEV